MEKISKQNYSSIFKTYIEENNLDLKKISKSLNCSLPTLTRLLSKVSQPSDEMLKQTGVLITIGFAKYEKLSNSDKEKISEKLGAVTLGGFGFVGIGTTISSLGIAGASGAGIMSGLAALGGIVGGGAIAGVTVAAAIPIAAGIVGYGAIKGLKYLLGNYKVNQKELNKRWEH